MKKFVLSILTLAAVALFAQPVFAEHSHDHGSAVQATAEEAAEPAGMMNEHESMMQESMQKMRAQMEKIKQTKDPKKRQKLLQEHSKSMRDSIKMMREMMAGMTMECASGGAMGGGNMMGCNMMGGDMMGGNMAGGHKKCDRMKSDPQANQPEGNAEAAPPVAQSSPDQAATIDKTPADAVKKLWSCPMHPDVVQDHPGTCPLCGMDLVEMEQPGATQPEHSHTMGGDMKDGCMGGGGMMGNRKMGECMKGGGMKDGCMGSSMSGGMGGGMGGGMMGDHKKGECMKGGGMKDGCMGGGMSGGMSGGMMGDHKMGECMKGGRMGGDCMKGSGMKDGCMGGGMKCQMRKMTDQHMGMMLMLMEQMIEHDEAAMAIRK